MSEYKDNVKAYIASIQDLHTALDALATDPESRLLASLVAETWEQNKLLRGEVLGVSVG